MCTEVESVFVSPDAAEAEVTNQILKPPDAAEVVAVSEQRYQPLPASCIEPEPPEPLVPTAPFDKSKFANPAPSPLKNRSCIKEFVPAFANTLTVCVAAEKLIALAFWIT